MAKITIYEYVENSKKELEAFKRKWVQQNLTDPDNWPKEMEEGDWGEQELSERFGQ